MNDLTKKNTAYIGLLAGLTVALICLLTPFARGMTVLYQLLAVLATGVAIGLAFRSKIKNSFPVSIFGVLFGLGTTGVFVFINENAPILFTAFVVTATVFFFFLFSKFFNLKMNKILKYVLAIILFLVWFFFIPLVLLYIDRAIVFNAMD